MSFSLPLAMDAAMLAGCGRLTLTPEQQSHTSMSEYCDRLNSDVNLESDSTHPSVSLVSPQLVETREDLPRVKTPDVFFPHLCHPELKTWEQQIIQTWLDTTSSCGSWDLIMHKLWVSSLPGGLTTSRKVRQHTPPDGKHTHTRTHLHRQIISETTSSRNRCYRCRGSLLSDSWCGCWWHFSGVYSTSGPITRPWPRGPHRLQAGSSTRDMKAFFQHYLLASCSI